jgi:hypothetical protein
MRYPINETGQCALHTRRHRPGNECPTWRAWSFDRRAAWLNEHGWHHLAGESVLPAHQACASCGDEHVAALDRGAFSDLLAQAAWAVANHGFAERESSVDEDGGEWQALVTVSAAVLLNLSETVLAQTMRCLLGEGEHLVWVRQTDDGLIINEESAQVDAEPRKVRRIEQGWTGLFETVA